MAAATTGVEKIRENRLRRMAERQGLELHKSRRRDRRALDYDGRWLRDARTDKLVLGGEHGTTLDEIEVYLTGGDE
jgi:hypothetical protein